MRGSALYFASERTEAEDTWFIDHSPETGNVTRPLTLFRRLVLSGQRGDLGVGWGPALRGAITRYVARSTAVPFHFIGSAVDVALLDLIATTPPLTGSASANEKTARLHERVDSMREILRRKNGGELKRNEMLRAEVRAALAEL